jgi:aldehyde:ferredoxin oxidoreductase
MRKWIVRTSLMGEEMPNAYMGKILLVDLTTGSVTDEVLPDEFYEKNLSGMGLAARILYDRIPKDADPLGPENMLGFVSGLLTGTGSLFTGRWMACGKSPVTGGWGDSNCGGYLSPAIKRAGYDGIFVSGCAQEPVYLAVVDGTARIKDAGKLWGKETLETEMTLKEEYGKRSQVASIGPGGEKLSLMAGIANDKGRMAARSGLGAVMGSKKLKAIVVDGKERVAVHDRDQVKSLSQRMLVHLKKKMPLPPGSVTPTLGKAMAILPVANSQDGMLYVHMLKKWGTVSMNQASIEMGDSPIKNWGGSSRDFGPRRSATVTPDKIIENEAKKYHCYSCPLGCGGICKNVGGFEETHKPEYETCLALGGLLLNEDADTIFYLNEKLNRAGLDTISTGSSIAFAMECYEKGLLTKEDTGGLELTWGNASAIRKLVDLIIAREGIGDLLADGSALAAERLGKGSETFAMHSGGQDLPMHDSRLDPGHGLLFSADPTPGRHTTGCYLYYEMYQVWRQAKRAPKPSMLFTKNSKYKATPEKGAMAAVCSQFTQLFNGAGLCMFGAFMGAHRLPLFEWFNAATGWRLSPDEYLAIGHRIQTVRQAFNIKHGIVPKEVNATPRALGQPPQRKGPNKGRTIPISDLKSEYWRQLGWHPETGEPLPATLTKLEID